MNLKTFFRELKAAFHSFSVKEQLYLSSLAIVALTSAIGLLAYANAQTLNTIAAPGGSLNEGIIGTPRFINPLLAVSDADRDLTALIYSGLLRVSGTGELIPDLAERYEISNDTKTYTFILREGLTFHDGAPLTTEDVEFTILTAQNPLIKSLRRAAWEGVTVEKVSPREIRFHLKQPYAAFLENATLGILPKHRWASLTPEAFPLAPENIEPIGSGPFQIADLKLDRNGLPVWYALKSFKDFALGAPKLERLTLYFYPNEEELLAAARQGEVESVSAIRPEVAAQLAAAGERILTAPFPRVFAVFFNQNEAAVFTQQEVRQALNLTANKEAVVKQVLAGYGRVIDGPLPPGALGAGRTPVASSTDQSRATALLTDSGWTKNADGIWTKKTKSATYTLSFSLAVPSTPELKAAAELLAQAWRQFGAQVNIQVFELSDLNQNIIRPRKYEALFFGEILGRDPDPFAFWHSSQRLDPGLNVALYTNITADKLLAEARVTEDRATRAEKLAAFEAEVKSDQPAVFMYAPDFIYLIPARVQGITLPPPVTPADRFANVYQWYTQTDRVWPIFTRSEDLISH